MNKEWTPLRPKGYLHQNGALGLPSSSAKLPCVVFYLFPYILPHKRPFYYKNMAIHLLPKNVNINITGNPIDCLPYKISHTLSLFRGKPDYPQRANALILSAISPQNESGLYLTVILIPKVIPYLYLNPLNFFIFKAFSRQIKTTL